MPRVADPSTYGKVPLPDTFPGEFFVLEWDRDAETFLLTLDDEDHSTYDLGDDVEAVQTIFRVRNYPSDKSDDLIDQAREFGGSQYIPNPHRRVEDRVLPILPRDARRAVIDFNPPDHARLQHPRR